MMLQKLLCTILVLAASPALAAPNGLVISGFQVRGPVGGNDEYIELRNTSSSSVDISGWKVQGCASGTPGAASTRATVADNIVLTAGQYYLFTNNGSSGYSGTVAGDQTYGTGITDFSGTNFAGIQLLDASNVRQDGVGSALSPCREGTGFATPTTNGASNAFVRTQDTDDNVADFTGPQASDPHNSGGIVPPPCANDGLHIAALQGAGHVSPYRAQCVRGVPGVVTQLASNGFYMQDPVPDASAATSEGIFVFTNVAPSPSITVGSEVTVDGTIEEFRAGSSFGATNCPASSAACNLTITEITGPTVVLAPGTFPTTTVLATTLGNGGRVPPPLKIDSFSAASVEAAGHVFDAASNGIDFYESLEGMRVQVNDARAVGPTNAFGEIFVVGDAGANATGTNARGGVTLVDRGTDGIDFNPERIQIDTRSVTSTFPQVNVGDTAALVQGVVSYSFGNFEIVPSTLPAFTDNGLAPTTSALTTGADRLRIASYNVENLDPNDLDTCDGDPDEDIAGGRFAREAQQIVDSLESPDVIGLEEIQDETGCTNDGVVDATLTLTTLVQAIVDAGGPTYAFALVNPANLQDGGQPGGNIRVGFLYNPARVTLVPGTAGAGDATTATSLSVDGSGRLQLTRSPGRLSPTSTAFANSRKPLAATFDFNGLRVLAIVNHFNSKGGDMPLFGRFQPPTLASETQRTQQAEIVHDFVEAALALDAGARVVVLGDLNDFEFSGPMRVLSGASEGSVILHDLAARLHPEEERYSYVFEGNSQELDHIYVTDALLSEAEVEALHLNSEFAEQVSDHDPSMASLKISTCGDTSGPGGTDLPCRCGDTVTTDSAVDDEEPVVSSGPSDVCSGPALIVAPGVSLNLRDSRLRGDGSSCGIIVKGGAAVRRGIVSGFADGICGRGDGMTILSITAKENSDSGIEVTGNGNAIRKNTARLNDGDGMRVQGSGNTLRDNRASRNGDAGLIATGGGNIDGGHNVGSQNGGVQCLIDGAACSP